MIAKFENIQGLRGIAVLIVVFFHLTGIEATFLPQPHILPSFLSFGAAGVDLFFVISGFVMVLITRNQFQNFESAKHFIYHRFTRIFPLYWFYATCLLLIHIFILHKPVVPNATTDYILKSYILWPQANLPFLPVAWTLIYEIYFYLMITLFLFAPEKSLLKWLGFWGSTMLAVNILLQLHPKFSTPLLATISNPLIFEFMAGCLIALVTFKGYRKYPLHLAIAGPILFIIGFSICYFLSPNPMQDITSGWQRLICFGIPVIVIVYAGVVCEYHHKVMPKFIRTIGNHSYSIYLSHLILLSAWLKFFRKLPWQTPLSHGIFVIVGVIIVLWAGKLSYRYIEKPILKYSRKWSDIVFVTNTVKE